MTDNKLEQPIIGKSVEEIEAEEGNTTNSSVPREERLTDADGLPGLFPAVGPGQGFMMAGGIPQVVLGTELADQGEGADRRDDGQSDGDESSES